MENKDKPAFPLDENTTDRIDYVYSGLTKREWLIGMALNGILSGNSIAAMAGAGMWDMIASDAISAADAVLSHPNMNNQ